MENRAVMQADRDEFSFPHAPEVVGILRELDEGVLRTYESINEQPLRRFLAESYVLSEEQVFLEQGNIGIIHRVFDYLLTKESLVLLSHPGYPYHEKLAKHHGARVLQYSIIEQGDSFAIDVTSVLRGLEEKPTLVVLTDPESPLGCSWSLEDLERVLQATDQSTLVLLDQAHEGFRSGHIKDVVALVKKYPHLLVARSFSKYYGLAGLRVAYALCGVAVKEKICFWERYLGFNSIAQVAAIACLKNNAYYEEKACFVRSEKDRLRTAINQLPGYKAYKTDHISLLLRPPKEQLELLEKNAQLAGIHFRDLKEYFDPSNDPAMQGLLRITLGTHEQNERILDLFSSVSWLYSFSFHNTPEIAVMNIRDAGYTIHRYTVDFEKAGIPIGYYKVIIPPDHEVPEHKHDDQDEFFHFLTPASMRVGDKTIEISEGAVRVKPGELHAIHAQKARFTRYFCTRFPYKHEDKKKASGEQIIHVE